MDRDCEFPFERFQGLLEPMLADVTPRTDDVRDNVELDGLSRHGGSVGLNKYCG
jgi:hypothetical protein